MGQPIYLLTRQSLQTLPLTEISVGLWARPSPRLEAVERLRRATDDYGITTNRSAGRSAERAGVAVRRSMTSPLHQGIAGKSMDHACV